MKKCEKCNIAYNDDKNFCKKCGEPLEFGKTKNSSNENATYGNHIKIGVISIITICLLSIVFLYYIFNINSSKLHTLKAGNKKYGVEFTNGGQIVYKDSVLIKNLDSKKDSIFVIKSPKKKFILVLRNPWHHILINPKKNDFIEYGRPCDGCLLGDNFSWSPGENYLIVPAYSYIKVVNISAGTNKNYKIKPVYNVCFWKANSCCISVDYSCYSNFVWNSETEVSFDIKTKIDEETEKYCKGDEILPKFNAILNIKNNDIECNKIE